MIHFDFSREELEAICTRREVKRLSLSGPVLHSDFEPADPIEAIAEFEDDAERKEMDALREELTELFGGHRIDLREAEFRHSRRKRHMMSLSEEIYGA